MLCTRCRTDAPCSQDSPAAAACAARSPDTSTTRQGASGSFQNDHPNRSERKTYHSAAYNVHFAAVSVAFWLCLMFLSMFSSIGRSKCPILSTADAGSKLRRLGCQARLHGWRMEARLPAPRGSTRPAIATSSATATMVAPSAAPSARSRDACIATASSSKPSGSPCRTPLFDWMGSTREGATATWRSVGAPYAH